MNFILAIWAYYLEGKIWRSKFMTILMLIASWPYAITGAIVPLLHLANVDSKRKITLVVKLRTWLYQMVTVTILGAVYILLPLTLIERFYYGKWAIPSANALIYNLISNDPSRFGVESWTYYLKNLLLNFNVFLPFVIFQKEIDWVTFTVLASFFAFSMQAHKEERFLYHIYPLISLLSARGIKNLIGRRGKKLKILLFLIGAIFGSLRMMVFFTDLNGLESLIKGRDGVICLTDTWYLSPPSMVASQKARYAFIKDNIFKGALPLYNIKGKNVNDMNKEIEGQYINDIEKCDHVVSKEEYPITLPRNFRKESCISLMDLSRTMMIRRWLWMPKRLDSLSRSYQKLCIYSNERFEQE